MQLNMRNKAPDGESGFTLIELMIVLVIFAVLTIPLLNYYNQYQQAQKRIVTIERMDYAASQIRIFRPSTFSYPCPADRSLGLNDPGYGIQNCPAFIALAVGTCSPGGGMCKVTGSRNADGVGGADPVLIGALPFRSIDDINKTHIGVEGSLDGWGNKLTYVVSANTTEHISRNSLSVGNDFKYGVIAAIDEFGNNTAGIGMFDLDNADGDNDPLTGADGDAQFALISHGPTGIGSFSVDGIVGTPCNAATRDGENCDDDFTFRASLGDYNAGGATFYDDLTYFYRDQTGDLWGYISDPDPSANGASTGHIRKLSLGNVGVNTGTNPVGTELDINGTVRAVTTLNDFYCKKDGSACLPTRYLWDELVLGTNIPVPIFPVPDSPPFTTAKNWTNSCPGGQVLTHYSNGTAQCAAKVTITAPPSPVNCPAGTYVRGLLTNGCVICSDDQVYPSFAACNN